MSDYYYSGGLQASESGCVARVRCASVLRGCVVRVCCAGVLRGCAARVCCASVLRGCVARVCCVAQLECSKIIEHNIWSRRFVELSSINMVSEIEIESSKF